MVTDRDRQILLHMEKYKYATIEQLRKIFFPTQKTGYDIVRRRMRQLEKAGYINIIYNSERNKLMYLWNSKEVKMPSEHRLILLDVLAKLHEGGAEVLRFDIEKEWSDGKIRSDGFAVFTVYSSELQRNIHVNYFIEVQLSNSLLNLEKYDSLYDTGEVQKYLKRNIFPRVLLITDRQYSNLKLKYSSVITLNTRLDSFMSVVLPPQKVN